MRPPERAREEPAGGTVPAQDTAAAAAERRRRLAVLAGAVVSLALAAVLFARFSIDEPLSRDEAIYAYGGQQQVEGVPFYVSIFDAKTPLASMIAGGGVAAGKVLGVNDVYAMRAAYFVFACLAVVAVYLLVLWLFQSVLAAVVGAATLASFKGFALDALTGPDAKTPGVFFSVLAMALLVKGRFFWGAFAGSLAFLVWQPLGLYAAVAVAAALLTADAGRRWAAARLALAGAAIPVALTGLYFALAGALDDMIDGTVVFVVTHLDRYDQTLGDRVRRIPVLVDRYYGDTALLFWGGLGLLILLAALRLARSPGFRRSVREDPYVNVVALSFVLVVGVCLTDMQGYPDLYPVLPYAAVGVGGGLALALRRLDSFGPPAVRAAAPVAAVVALFAVSWGEYRSEPGRADRLVVQRAGAAQIEELLEPGETLYALGSAVPLVLTERRNPSRYIYLAAGVDRWVVDHTPGGFDGWTAEIAAADPEIVVVSGLWRNELAVEMKRWLRTGYRRTRAIRPFTLFLSPAVSERAERLGLVRPRRP